MARSPYRAPAILVVHRRALPSMYYNRTGVPRGTPDISSSLAPFARLLRRLALGLV